jgi:excinuclease UvrABC ATPase subunit
VFDEPTIGLHSHDIQRMNDLLLRLRDKGNTVLVIEHKLETIAIADLGQLLGLLDRLVDSGKSVLVIEHHLSVMAHADWIIDLGPGAGHDGGRIVFAGTPADLVAAKSTLTGEHLAALVRSQPSRAGSRRASVGKPSASKAVSA